MSNGFEESKHNRVRGRFAPKSAGPERRASAPSPTSGGFELGVDELAAVPDRKSRAVAAKTSADPLVRTWFVENERRIDPYFAGLFADDPDPMVRLQLAQRWDVSVPLGKMLADPDPSVAFAAAMRPEVSESETLRVLAREDVQRFAALIAA